MPDLRLEPYLAQLDLLDKPLGEARGLPNALYTQPSLFEVERDRIFHRSWMVVAFLHDLEPSTALPVDVAGAPVVIVRDQRGTVRAFHNVSSFDGCEIVLHRTRGLTGLVGPYHGWQWDLTGRLLEAPFLHGRPTCTPEELAALEGDLVPVAVGVWHDLVFVNLAPAPGSLADHLAPLVERLHGTDLDVFVPAKHPDGSWASSTYDVAGNWKIVVENDVELLHEPFVHAFYREHPEISPKVDADGRPTAVEVSDRGLYGFHVPATMYFEEGQLASAVCAVTARGERFPDLGIYDLYPNLAVGIAPNSLTFTIIDPLSADRTRLRNYYYVHRDVAPGPEALADLEETIAIYEGARIEDDVVVESVQRGRRSASFASTPYSTFWFGLLRDFHRQIRDDLLRP